jgi:hypothetical protein
MKQKQTDASRWPAFASSLLQAVAAAFLRRRKAIRYQAALSCEREFSETALAVLERLNLDVRRGRGDLRLTIWEDGIMWLRLCVASRGRNAGWAFNDQVRGVIHDVSPEVLVAMVEATISEPFDPGSSDAEKYRERLWIIWQRVWPGQ